MWRSKKFIIGLLAVILLVSASLGGVALAQDNEEDSQPAATLNAVWDKVATILQDEGVNITSDQLQNAVAKAQEQMRTEALENFLQKLVEKEKITQEEADQYLEWWLAKPDVSFGFGFRGHSGFRGIGGMRGWGGPCFPTQ